MEGGVAKVEGQNGGESAEDSAAAAERSLPPWAGEPIPTLRLEEYKREQFLGTIPLGEKKSYVFGREQKWVDVLLHHPSVSRRHAAIVHGTPPGTRAKDKNGCTLIDLGSSSGVYVQTGTGDTKKKKKVKACVLRDNVIIRFGDSTRLYKVKGIKGDPDATTTASGGVSSNPFHGLRDDDNDAGKVALVIPKVREDLDVTVNDDATLKRKPETAFSGQSSRANFEKKRRQHVKQIVAKQTVKDDIQ